MSVTVKPDCYANEFLVCEGIKYESDAFSVGSGTTTATVQLGIIRPLTARLSLDTAMDVSLTADHTEAGVKYSRDHTGGARNESWDTTSAITLSIRN